MTGYSFIDKGDQARCRFNPVRSRNVGGATLSRVAALWLQWIAVLRAGNLVAGVPTLRGKCVNKFFAQQRGVDKYDMTYIT